jgi:hypothetical protein
MTEFLEAFSGPVYVLVALFTDESIAEGVGCGISHTSVLNAYRFM